MGKWGFYCCFPDQKQKKKSSPAVVGANSPNANSNVTGIANNNFAQISYNLLNFSNINQMATGNLNEMEQSFLREASFAHESFQRDKNVDNIILKNPTGYIYARRACEDFETYYQQNLTNGTLLSFSGIAAGGSAGPGGTIGSGAGVGPGSAGGGAGVNGPGSSSTSQSGIASAMGNDDALTNDRLSPTRRQFTLIQQLEINVRESVRRDLPESVLFI